MPEAAMHEDNLASRGKDQIRFARQIQAMQAVAISQTMYQAPHRQFRLGVLVANKRHSFATFGRCQGIGHGYWCEVRKGCVSAWPHRGRGQRIYIMFSLLCVRVLLRVEFSL